MHIFELPPDMLSNIYLYDPTYRIVLQTEVHKELIKLSWITFFKRFLEYDLFDEDIINEFIVIFLFIITEEIYGTSHHDDIQISSNWKDIAYFNNSLSHLPLVNLDDEFYIDIQFGVGAKHNRLETIVYSPSASRPNHHDVLLTLDDDLVIVRILL